MLQSNEIMLESVHACMRFRVRTRSLSPYSCIFCARTWASFRSDVLDPVCDASAGVWRARLWRRECVFHLSMCVGMQQANRSIAGHVSSMIANRLPPQSSV